MKLSIQFLILRVLILTIPICSLYSQDKGPYKAHFLFAHGWQGDKSNVDWYTGKRNPAWSIITGPYLSFDFPDVDLSRPDKVNPHLVNVGQTLDILALETAYKKLLQVIDVQDLKLHRDGIVMIGSSRGAATAINAASTRTMPYLKAVVAEAPFDVLANAIDHFLLKHQYLGTPYSFLPMFLQEWAQKKAISSYFPAHKTEDVYPLLVIHNFPHTVPIILVHSKTDTTNPMNSSRLLYLELLRSGHKKAYLLELDYGPHYKYNRIYPDSSEALKKSAHKYLTAIHAFYKANAIPYDEKLAFEGQRYIDSGELQPSAAVVEKRIAEST